MLETWSLPAFACWEFEYDGGISAAACKPVSSRIDVMVEVQGWQIEFGHGVLRAIAAGSKAQATSAPFESHHKPFVFRDHRTYPLVGLLTFVRDEYYGALDAVR
jgi:hypothetical protein